MRRIIPFSQVIESNDKTVRENNNAIPHQFPIGALVEVDMTFGPVANIEKVDGKEYCLGFTGVARMIVVKHTRDCDGSPMYTLCTQPVSPPDTIAFSQDQLIYRYFMRNVETGYSDHSLKAIGPVVPVQTFNEWRNMMRGINA